MLSWYCDPMSSWQLAHFTLSIGVVCGNSVAVASGEWQSTHAKGPCVDDSSAFWSSWQVRQSSLVGGSAAAGPATSQAAARRTPIRVHITVSRYGRTKAERAPPLLLPTTEVRHERIYVVFRERVLLHLRFPHLLRLRVHRLRVDDPGADVIGRILRADGVERPLRVALAGNRMAQRTFLIHEELRALRLCILCPGRRRDEQAQPHRHQNRTHHSDPPLRRAEQAPPFTSSAWLPRAGACTDRRRCAAG